MTNNSFEILTAALHAKMRELPVTDIQGRKEIQDELDIRAIRRYAEKVREMHFWVATQENGAVCASGSEPYETSQATLIAAIRMGWAKSDSLDEADILRVYDIWVECNETLAYCVAWHVRDKADRIAAERDELHSTDAPTRSDISSEYPELDKDDIQGVYDVWLACGQTIAYCVKWYMRAKAAGNADMAAEHAEIAHKPHLYTDTYNQDELDKFVAMRLN